MVVVGRPAAPFGGLSAYAGGPIRATSAIELERWLDREFGEPVRRVFYFHALNHPGLLIPLFIQGEPWWGRLFCRVGFRTIANRMRQMYAITAENARSIRIA